MEKTLILLMFLIAIGLQGDKICSACNLHVQPSTYVCEYCHSSFSPYLQLLRNPMLPVWCCKAWQKVLLGLSALEAPSAINSSVVSQRLLFSGSSGEQQWHCYHAINQQLLDSLSTTPLIQSFWTRQ